MRLILMAPPGGGKGTQAERLSNKYDISQVETGGILRQAVQEESELGEKAQKYMNEGKLVPDEIMIGIIRERLTQPDCSSGFILDGFPRTLPQAKELDRLFDEQDLELDAVLYLNVPEEVIYDRLSRRRVCPECDTTYHLDVNPPEKDGVCDSCGTEIVQREDDRKESIKKRLEEYRQKTQPVLDFYRNRGLLYEIDGDMTINEVTEAIGAVLR